MPGRRPQELCCAGPKLIQVTLSLDRLLETVTDAAKDLRNEGTHALHMTLILTAGAFDIALLNFLPVRQTARSAMPAPISPSHVSHDEVHASGPHPISPPSVYVTPSTRGSAWGRHPERHNGASYSPYLPCEIMPHGS